MTQPEDHPPRALTRPAIGVLVDPERMAAARKSAMLERIELAALSQLLDLRKIAFETGCILHPINMDKLEEDLHAVREYVADAGINLKKQHIRVGVSRDEIAKLESRTGKRPKITTLRKLIAALNHARAERGKPPLDIEDLQVPGEVLVPPDREQSAIDAYQEQSAIDAYQEQSAIDAYQEASNEIYYDGPEFRLGPGTNDNDALLP